MLASNGSNHENGQYKLRSPIGSDATRRSVLLNSVLYTASIIQQMKPIVLYRFLNYTKATNNDCFIAAFSFAIILCTLNPMETIHHHLISLHLLPITIGIVNLLLFGFYASSTFLATSFNHFTYSSALRSFLLLFSARARTRLFLLLFGQYVCGD